MQEQFSPDDQYKLDLDSNDNIDDDDDDDDDDNDQKFILHFFINRIKIKLKKINCWKEKRLCFTNISTFFRRSDFFFSIHD